MNASPETQTLVTVRSADGTQIACWCSGSGPAMVLVHGATLDHTSWDALRPELEPFFTLYAIERRGRGQSGDSVEFSFEREVEDVATVVESIGERVHVMGHSYGAVMALESPRLTANIASLILYDPPVISAGVDEMPEEFLEELERMMAQDQRDEAYGLFFQKVLGRTPGEVAQLRADPSWPDRLALAHTVVRELRVAQDYRFRWSSARVISQPTLLLTGEVSPARMHASVAALHAVLPTSQVTSLVGQGHGALRAAPKQVATEVLAFLRASVPA